MNATKEDVRHFWNRRPNGTGDAPDLEDERAKFADIEQRRYALEPFIPQFARFSEHAGQEMLEVGVGVGTDHIRFARAGARCHGVDISDVSLGMTRRRFALEGLSSDLRVADAEHLPFEDRRFDFVYSWGVIHHTPDTRRAASEILRVLRPGGTFCVMIYNRYSLLAAQAWLLYAAARGRPTRSIGDVLASHVESPGTQAFSVRESKALFFGAEEVNVSTVVTPYDMRIGRRRFLPQATWKLVPQRLGWFHVVTGRK